MGKKHKTNPDVSEDSRHLASNDSIVEKKCRGSEANEDGQDSRLVKNGISGVSIPTILEAIKGHCSLPIMNLSGDGGGATEATGSEAGGGPM
uniref:Uncharacterized protein n=1 Tax=Oryza glumipatula TaxID=40148 RepID=A0A0E0BPC3_9ORYZ